MAKAILMVFQTGIRIPLETKGETIQCKNIVNFFLNMTGPLWKGEPSSHEMEYLMEEIFNQIFKGEF